MTKSKVFQILSSLFFAILGAELKFFSRILSIETIIFFRSIIGFIIILILILILRFIFNKKNYLRSHNIKIQFLRAIFGSLAMYLGYSALTFLPLAQATALSFTKVFFVIFFSYLCFKEKITFKNIFFSLIGFCGVYLLIDPSQVRSLNGTLLSLLSSIFVAAGIISISFLTRKDHTLSILFFHSFFSSSIIGVIFYNKILFPSFYEFLSLFLITITALLGQYFNAESYKNKEANIIVIYSYTRIIFSMLLGYIFFSETLNFSQFSGLFLIIFTTIFVKDKTNKKI